jgi:hypothetical protein
MVSGATQYYWNTVRFQVIQGCNNPFSRSHRFLHHAFPQLRMGWIKGMQLAAEADFVRLKLRM